MAKKKHTKATRKASRHTGGKTHKTTKQKKIDIGEIVVAQNYVSAEEIASARKLAAAQSTPLDRALIDQGLLTKELLDSALAEYYKMPHYDLSENPPSPELVLLLPEEIAREHEIVVVEKKGREIIVATSKPGTEGLEKIIRENFQRAEEEEPKKKGLFGSKKKAAKGYSGKVSLVFAKESSIESAFAHYRKPLVTRFQAIIEKQRKVAPEIIEEIFSDAIELRASDIHFEPQEETVIVRFRVDGVMHEAGRIPTEYYEGVVNRVKIAGNMRIDEHFAAQDGAIRYEHGEEATDIRVSIVPVVDGEKIVMRLLSQYVRTLTLADLGFSEEHQEILEKASAKPFGMILTTGPTGSGKSTTLYALLKLRNRPDVNISTIEDPVEYKVQGVNHIQTNETSGLTFAKGLRALVRQDPDVILVGEIRDGETADISINAALTGHLLFSTLHSNDAPTAIPRLLEMGTEPFLMASTLEVIVGQRLVRRICPHCRYSTVVPAAKARKLFPGAQKLFPKSKSVTLYQGKGCDACGGTGYRGRIGIYELLEVTPEIEDLIVKRASTTDISKVARKQGMKFMFEDGFEKVRAGITTFDELLRVAQPPDQILSKKRHGTRK